MSSFLDVINDNIYINRSKSQSPYPMPEMHYHDCYEIIYFLAGDVSYFVNDEIYPMRKYDLIFIPPFAIHRVIDNGDKFYERIVLNFKEKLFANTPFDRKILEFFSSEVKRISITNHDIRNIFNSICYEQKVKDDFSDRRIILLLEELLILLNRESKQNKLQPDSNIKDEKVLSIISYINENYMNNITLPLLSDKFYISQSYLVHLFKDRTGFTIMEYLNKKRISISQQMLSTNNYNISTVGELVGYNNLTSFSRTFKEIVGVSPMQYKKYQRSK